jgi:hypothetical protein
LGIGLHSNKLHLGQRSDAALLVIEELKPGSNRLSKLPVCGTSDRQSISTTPGQVQNLHLVRQLLQIGLPAAGGSEGQWASGTWHQPCNPLPADLWQRPQVE